MWASEVPMGLTTLNFKVNGLHFRGVIDSKFGCTMQKIKIYFLDFLNIFIFFLVFHIFFIIFSHYLMHWNSAEHDYNNDSFILHDLRFQFKFNKKR